MDTKKYEVFEKIVELSSLSRAAEELGLTQSGVSHILASLEEEFGFPLLKRSRVGARLTPEGERLMPFVRDILRSQEQLDQTAAELRGLAAGTRQRVLTIPCGKLTLGAALGRPMVSVAAFADVSFALAFVKALPEGIAGSELIEDLDRRVARVKAKRKKN